MDSAPSAPNYRANFTHTQTIFTRAFTLPELLVIASTVIILFALVLPAISNDIAEQFNNAGLRTDTFLIP